MNKILIIILPLFLLISCAETKKEKITRLVREMEGKKIVFPDNIVYTIYGTDTVDYVLPKREFTIVSYVDSVGCTTCKLQLYGWKKLINEIDSLSNKSVSYIFIFQPKELNELTYFLRRDNFDIPVWIDETGSFSHINQLPAKQALHTFLIHENKITVIGNPVNNLNIKNLYYKIILNKDFIQLGNHNLSRMMIDNSVINLGEFDWKEEQKRTINITNISSNILVINDIMTSCGCINVIYPKEPIKPGECMKIELTYNADNPEYINKTLKLYSNTENSPHILTVRGTAK